MKKKVKEEREIHRLKIQIQDTIDKRQRAVLNASIGSSQGVPSISQPTIAVANGEANNDIAVNAIMEIEGCVASTMPSAANEIPLIPSPPPPPTTTTVLASDMEDILSAHLRPLREELAAAQSRLVEVDNEETILIKELELEKVKVLMIKEWMKAMQGVMWPTNNEDLEIGKPLEPPPLHPGVDEFSLLGLGLDKGLLSEGMKKAHSAALALGIQHIEDVVIIFEGFKWMCWLNLLLFALRRPLPMRALRLFIEASQHLQCNDEKVTKVLLTWYQRGRYSIYI